MVNTGDVLNISGQFYAARLGSDAHRGGGSSRSWGEVEFQRLFEGRHTDYNFDDGSGHCLVDGGEIVIFMHKMQKIRTFRIFSAEMAGENTGARR